MTDDNLEESAAPVFFLSYARSRQANAPVAAAYEVNEYVMRLYRDLTLHVNQLIALPAGRDPGFMDMTMKGGVLWEKELLTAAGTCQVLICLLSPPYLTRSEWCAMEWDIFSRRDVVRRSDDKPADETSVVPVLWAPIPGEVPEMVNQVTRFAPRNLADPAFGPLYEENGFFGVLNSDPKYAYPALVWKLAMRIQELHATYYVKPGVPASTDGLLRAFPRS